MIQCTTKFCNIEFNLLLLHCPHSIQLKSQVTAQHEIKNHEQVFVVLKSKFQITETQINTNGDEDGDAEIHKD